MSDRTDWRARSGPGPLPEFGVRKVKAKAATALGFDLSHAEFWQWPGPKHALAESVLSDTSSLTDFGMLFGAMAAAAASKPFAQAAGRPRNRFLPPSSADC